MKEFLHKNGKGSDDLIQIITSMKQLNFRQLTSVYSDEISAAGKEQYSDLNQNLQILEAEQDFYHYLSEFFRTPKAFYAVWVIEGCYRAALRIEPYKDGVILAGLQTAIDSRKKGYASDLMCATLKYLSENDTLKVYSHIRKDNIPSIKCHTKNGFVKALDYSHYINGDVDRCCDTYLKNL